MFVTTRDTTRAPKISPETSHVLPELFWPLFRQQPLEKRENVIIIKMMRINQELSDRLAQRMWVDPGDEDFGRCFFNARRALFRITRLKLVDEAVYTEGFAIDHSYKLDLHCVAAHGWVTHNDQVIDVDYADHHKYDAVYFSGLHLLVDEVYQRLKASSPPGAQTAFGLVPMGVDMTRAYVQACEYLHTAWPEEVTPYDREHLSQWRDNLATLTRRE